jgi:hypothetical protein
VRDLRLPGEEEERLAIRTVDPVVFSGLTYASRRMRYGIRLKRAGRPAGVQHCPGLYSRVRVRIISFLR